MYKKKKILGIIPARKGSKSIKNKNLLKINNKTLTEIAINSAKKSKFLCEIVVTSDNMKVLNLAKKKKIKTINRKKKISGDKSLMYEVVLDVIKKYEKYDYIMILQVTNPFRNSKMIDKSIKKLINSEADTLVSVTKVDDVHPSRMYKMKKKYLKSYDKKKENFNRQDLEKLYHRNGQIYLFKKENLIRYKNFYGKKILPIITNKEDTINIDSYFDYVIAKLYYEKKNS
jgi:CMP-N-acetylneuraminic acid synthetase